MHAVIDEILNNHRPHVGQANHQGIFGLRGLDPDVLDAHAIHDLEPFTDLIVGLSSVNRNVFGVFLVLLRRHPVSSRGDLAGNGRKRVKRRCELAGAQQMIGMIVSDVQACDWLAEPLRVCGHLACEWHRVPFTAPLDGRCVMSLEAVVVQSRSAPRADSRTSIAALADQDWILNSGGCGYRAALERAMANQDLGMRVFVDSQDIEEQLKLVASGLGLGLVPHEFLNLSASHDQLTIIEVFDFVLTIDVCLVYGKALGNLGKTLGTLAATLEEKFGPSLKVSTVPRTAVA
jgi:hypothetical protein